MCSMETAIFATWKSLQHDLKGFVNSRVKNKSIAEDIVQDVFIKVQSNARQLKDARKISSWIYQITRNMIADHFRNNARKALPIPMDWESDQQEFNDCVARCLKVLMSTLPEKYRRALELTDLENLSQLELSKKLNISYAGARSRVQRGRKMLRDKLNELFFIKTDSYGNIVVCEDKVPCCCSCK